jgi:hypothetical protein
MAASASGRSTPQRSKASSPHSSPLASPSSRAQSVLGEAERRLKATAGMDPLRAVLELGAITTLLDRHGAAIAANPRGAVLRRTLAAQLRESRVAALQIEVQPHVSAASLELRGCEALAEGIGGGGTLGRGGAVIGPGSPVTAARDLATLRRALRELRGPLLDPLRDVRLRNVPAVRDIFARTEALAAWLDKTGGGRQHTVPRPFSREAHLARLKQEAAEERRRRREEYEEEERRAEAERRERQVAAEAEAAARALLPNINNNPNHRQQRRGVDFVDGDLGALGDGPHEQQRWMPGSVSITPGMSRRSSVTQNGSSSSSSSSPTPSSSSLHNGSKAASRFTSLNASRAGSRSGSKFATPAPSSRASNGRGSPPVNDDSWIFSGSATTAHDGRSRPLSRAERACAELARPQSCACGSYSVPRPKVKKTQSSPGWR